MVKIVYGVSGDGSGHSSRAREVLTHLVAQGHQVKVVSYDRGYRNLKDTFDVFETEGLNITAQENRVSLVQTFVDNLLKVPEGYRRLRELKAEVFEGFEPDVVFTDFEPMTAYLANSYDIPLVSLDNQHRMRYMVYPCPTVLRTEALVTETVIKMMVPWPDVSLVTTFYFGERKNEYTFLFPPILRDAVHQLEPSDQGHILVYFTQAFDSFAKQFDNFPRERFLVYGTDPRPGAPSNVEFRPFSRDGFLADLAGAKAVIGTAGFTLITESLHLRKPYLALPMAGQFEQELNAHLIGTAGYGKNGRGGADTETIGDFLYRLPEYREKLADYQCEDNSRILDRIDELLADGAREAKEYHQARLDSTGPHAAT